MSSWPQTTSCECEDCRNADLPDPCPTIVTVDVERKLGEGSSVTDTVGADHRCSSTTHGYRDPAVRHHRRHCVKESATN